jgi:HSP20 family molecular chaperone IbpA
MDDHDDDHDRDRDRDRETGLLGAIRHVFDALIDAEREGRSNARGAGRIPKGHFQTEYSFSGRIGSSDSGQRTGEGSTGSSRSGEEYLVDARYDENEDELLVIADLPDVELEDLTVGIDRDRDQLVVGVGNDPVDRIDLPWPVEDVDSRFHHGVLEIRLIPEVSEE